MWTNNAREFNWSWPIVSRSKKFKKSSFFLLHYIFANPTRCEVHRTKAHQQLKAFPQISFVIIWKFSERKLPPVRENVQQHETTTERIFHVFCELSPGVSLKIRKSSKFVYNFISIQKTFLVSVNSTNSYYDSAWHLIKSKYFQHIFIFKIDK